MLGTIRLVLQEDYRAFTIIYATLRIVRTPTFTIFVTSLSNATAYDDKAEYNPTA